LGPPRAFGGRGGPPRSASAIEVYQPPTLPPPQNPPQKLEPPPHAFRPDVAVLGAEAKVRSIAAEVSHREGEDVSAEDRRGSAVPLGWLLQQALELRGPDLHHIDGV